MSERRCERFSEEAPELALGTLDGRRRAEALDHLRHCPRCQRELSGYTEVADGLLDLVAAAEPPAGFETRALDAIAASRAAADGVTGGAGPGRRAGRPHRRRRLQVAVASVAALTAVAVAGYGVGERGTGSYALRRATLTAAGRPVGAAYLYGGLHPWVYMGLTAAGSGRATVTCELERGGQPATPIGTFTIVGGSGSWGAPAPLPPGQVTGARLVDSEGVTVAEGNFNS